MNFVLPAILWLLKIGHFLPWSIIESLEQFLKHFQNYYLIFIHLHTRYIDLPFYRCGNWCPKRLCVFPERLKSVLESHFLFSKWIHFLQGYIDFWNNNPTIYDIYDHISAWEHIYIYNDSNDGIVKTRQ